MDIVERLRLLVGQFAQDACGVFVCISPLDAAHMSGAHGWPASPTPKKNCYFSSAPDQPIEITKPTKKAAAKNSAPMAAAPKAKTKAAAAAAAAPAPAKKM